MSYLLSGSCPFVVKYIVCLQVNIAFPFARYLHITINLALLKKKINIRGRYFQSSILSTFLSLFSQNRPQYRPYLDKMDVAIPQFHAYGHIMSCKLKYSPRYLPGFGLTDGEGTERLWSYVIGTATITKEMAPSSREDFLETALQFFTKNKVHNLGKHSCRFLS